MRTMEEIIDEFIELTKDDGPYDRKSLLACGFLIALAESKDMGHSPPKSAYTPQELTLLQQAADMLITMETKA